MSAGLLRMQTQSDAKDAKYWIDKLSLIPHPEGGYYRETYRSNLSIPEEALPAQFTGRRLVSSTIYFLLEGENFSAFHRLRSDEMWHFYYGGPLVVHTIGEAGSYSHLEKTITSGTRLLRLWPRFALHSGVCKPVATV